MHIPFRTPLVMQELTARSTISPGGAWGPPWGPHPERALLSEGEGRTPLPPADGPHTGVLPLPRPGGSSLRQERRSLQLPNCTPTLDPMTPTGPLLVTPPQEELVSKTQKQSVEQLVYLEEEQTWTLIGRLAGADLDIGYSLAFSTDGKWCWLWAQSSALIRSCRGVWPPPPLALTESIPSSRSNPPWLGGCA